MIAIHLHSRRRWTNTDSAGVLYAWSISNVFEIKRKPKTLSYSSLNLFEKDREEFFFKYLASNRPDKIPQEHPASIGSSFDARVKSELSRALGIPDNEYEPLFDAQVEPQNREFARPAGDYAFEEYKRCGAYDDLLAILRTATAVQFESSVERTLGGVPMSGKPDCRFVLRPRSTPVQVILDWKCAGHCSKNTTSPTKGYRLVRDCGGWPKPSRNNGEAHNLYLAYDHCGFEVSAGFMETCSEKYADQTTIYGWLLGAEPGDESVVVMIDELVAKPNGDRPLLRVANHRARVTSRHQLALLDRIKKCWDTIQSGHIFSELSREENDERCELLDSTAAALKTGGEGDWFSEVTRPKIW